MLFVGSFDLYPRQRARLEHQVRVAPARLRSRRATDLRMETAYAIE